MQQLISDINLLNIENYDFFLSKNPLVFPAGKIICAPLL